MTYCFAFKLSPDGIGLVADQRISIVSSLGELTIENDSSLKIYKVHETGMIAVAGNISQLRYVLSGLSEQIGRFLTSRRFDYFISHCRSNFNKLLQSGLITSGVPSSLSVIYADARKQHSKNIYRLVAIDFESDGSLLSIKYRPNNNETFVDIGWIPEGCRFLSSAAMDAIDELESRCATFELLQGEKMRSFMNSKGGFPADIIQNSQFSFSCNSDGPRDSSYRKEYRQFANRYKEILSHPNFQLGPIMSFTAAAERAIIHEVERLRLLQAPFIDSIGTKWSTANLGGIARHLRYSDVKKPEFAARLLERAIEKDEALAVIDCLLFALESYGTEKVEDVDSYLREALTFLNDRKDSRWVSGAWFLEEATKFYKELTPERTAQVLENLGYLRQVDYQAERILVRLAERQPEAIWDYFGVRLAKEETAAGEDEERFEAVPFQFHGLENELSKDPQLAINKGLSWFSQDQRLFQFRGGRLLSSAFPDCTPEFATALAELVKAGGDTEADFALAILQNYQGETSSYVVLKEIVSRFPDDAHKMDGVRASIDSTGVVSGEFGFVEAWRAKKESLAEWLADERPAVHAFAEKHIAELELMIASEQRRAEAEREMRKRSYDGDGESDDGNQD